VSIFPIAFSWSRRDKDFGMEILEVPIKEVPIKAPQPQLDHDILIRARQKVGS
jgi:hypothetical protein